MYCLMVYTQWPLVLYAARENILSTKNLTINPLSTLYQVTSVAFSYLLRKSRKARVLTEFRNPLPGCNIFTLSGTSGLLFCETASCIMPCMIKRKIRIACFMVYTFFHVQILPGKVQAD